VLLAIDVGNSDTKLGAFNLEGGSARLLETWRVETALRRTADEYGVLVGTLFRFAKLEAAAVTAIVISSVVPQSDRALSEACKRYFSCEPLFFSAASQTMIEVTTERPKELGSDLLAAAIAARAAYGSPLIVIGFGTATTFGAVSREGEYVGAALAPGIRISIDALVERTAKLPQVALDAPNGPIGRDTVSALQAGIIYGFVGQTEALVARMRHAIGEDARVVATGGLADVVAKHTEAIDAVEPHLVLQGLALWHASLHA
jgi:type III pantothenate kinase